VKFASIVTKITVLKNLKIKCQDLPFSLVFSYKAIIFANSTTMESDMYKTEFLTKIDGATGLASINDQRKSAK